MAHSPTCSVACGIFPDQGSNRCPVHWQEDSQPLRHQGSLALDIIHYFLFPNDFIYLCMYVCMYVCMYLAALGLSCSIGDLFLVAACEI